VVYRARGSYRALAAYGHFGWGWNPHGFDEKLKGTVGREHRRAGEHLSNEE
jgi:hypothetical protein